MDSSKLEIALWIYMIFWRLEHVEGPGWVRERQTGGPPRLQNRRVETPYFCLDLTAFRWSYT